MSDECGARPLRALLHGHYRYGSWAENCDRQQRTKTAMSSNARFEESAEQALLLRDSWTSLA